MTYYSRNAVHVVARGLEAIGTLQRTYDTDTAHRLTRLADRLDLLTTGGSDHHGPHRSTLPGQSPAGRPIPRGVYDTLLARLGSRRRQPQQPAAAAAAAAA